MAVDGARIAVRVGDDLLARIDDEAKQRNTSRSNIVRLLLDVALNAPESAARLDALTFQMTEIRVAMMRRISAEIREMTPDILESMIGDELELVEGE